MTQGEGQTRNTPGHKPPPLVARSTPRGVDYWPPAGGPLQRLAAEAHGLPSTDREADQGFERDSRSRDARIRRSLAVADAAAAAAAMILAVHAGQATTRPAALLLLPLVVVLSKMLGLYDRDELLMHKSTLDEAPLLAQLAILLTAAVWLTEHAVIEGALGKVQFLTLFVTGFGGLLTTRSIARWAAGRWAPRERCLLLGDATAYQRLADKLALQGSAGTELVGRVDLDGASNGTSVNDRLREIVREHRVHRIVVAPSNTDSELALNLIREANTLGIKISLLPRFSEALGSSVVFDELPGMTLMAARRFGLSRSSLMLKRAFDLCAVTIGMVVVAPLMAVIGVAVLLDSRGPVLFRQARVGQDGESFQMLKFRTMRDGADEQKPALMALNEGVGMFKIAKDPRVTRVGRLLRRTSLDELPQLFNVLKGDMSLVGPRPLVSEEDQRIEGWHRRRLNLLPGMTGHWQVLGGARIPLPEMLAIDYLYVANWSLWTDLKYLLRTVPHILSGRGM